MAPITKLDKIEQGKNVDIKLYRSMIDSLLYLTINRSDILLSIYLYARFQSCPKESHLIVLKRIIRYFKDTIGMSLWYPKIEQFSMILFRCRLYRL